MYSKNVIEQTKLIRTNLVLREILDSLKAIDFRERKYPGYKYTGLPLSKFPVYSYDYEVISAEEILTIAMRKKLGICKQNGSIYTYDGTYWSVLDVKMLEIFLGIAAEKLGFHKYEARHYRTIKSLCKQFYASACLPELEPSTEVCKINLENGTYEVSSFYHSLMPHNREDYLRYKLPFKHNETVDLSLIHI